MKTIEMIRFVSHHLGVAIATIGVFYVMYILWLEPSLLQYPMFYFSGVAYLAGYPFLVAMVLTEDILHVWSYIKKREVKKCE